MNAEIVTTGTELLLGVISDTNSTYIARQLCQIGLNLYFITSAGDNQERIAQVIDAALNRSDVVITTGGLGPTVDDVTREAVAQATSRPLVLDETLLASIEAFFARRGFKMSDNNRRQAQIPQGAIPLENPVGTAPCFIVEDERGVVISLPGVPREMEYMMTRVVIPYLRQKFNLTQVIKMRTLKTAGIGESAVDAQIGDLETWTNPTVGLAAHPGRVDIRLTAKADNEAQADAMLADLEARVRDKVGMYIFGADDDTLESAVIDMLRARNLTLAVTEVNTAGRLSGHLNRAESQGQVFAGGRVLSADYAGHLIGQELAQEAAALVQETHLLTHADVGLVAINRGPDQVYLLAEYGRLKCDKTLRYRGLDDQAVQWIASYALDLIRQMLLA